MPKISDICNPNVNKPYTRVNSDANYTALPLCTSPTVPGTTDTAPGPLHLSMRYGMKKI